MAEQKMDGLSDEDAPQFYVITVDVKSGDKLPAAQNGTYVQVQFLKQSFDTKPADKPVWNESKQFSSVKPPLKINFTIFDKAGDDNGKGQPLGKVQLNLAEQFRELFAKKNGDGDRLQDVYSGQLQLRDPKKPKKLVQGGKAKLKVEVTCQVLAPTLLQNRLDGAVGKYEDMKSRYAELVDVKDSLDSNAAKNKNLIDKLEKEVDNLKTENSTLTASAGDADMILDLSSQLQDKDDEIDALKAVRLEAKSLCLQVRAEVIKTMEDHNAALLAKDSEIEKVNSVRKEATLIANQARAEVVKTIEAYSLDMKQRDNEIQELKATRLEARNLAEQAREEVRKSIEDHAGNLQEKEGEIQKLQQVRHEATRLAEQVKVEVQKVVEDSSRPDNDLKIQLDQTRQDNYNLRETNKSGEDQFQQMRNQCADLQQRVLDLSKENDELREANADLKLDVSGPRDGPRGEDITSPLLGSSNKESGEDDGCTCLIM